MKQVIVSLLLLFPITVFLCTSCEKTKPTPKNDNKAEITQDTTKLDVTAESPADYGTNDDDYWVDEENCSDDDYRDPETENQDGLYTNLLPGKWFCKAVSENKTEYLDGHKLTYSINVSLTIVINPDYNFYEKVFTRVVLHQPVALDDHSGFGESIYYGGATIDITGESNGTWYVENSNIVHNISSWKITPAYYREHKTYNAADEKVIQEFAPTVKEMMDEMKRTYSERVSYQQILDINGNEMRINNGTKTFTYKKIK